MRYFANYHPAALLVYFLSVISISMFVPNPVIGGAAFFGGACFFALLKHGKGKRGDVAFYAFMLIMIALTNPLFSHSGITPLFFLNGYPVTLEAVACGAGTAVMITSVLIWCACFSEVMTEERLTYLFGRAIPKLSLILTTSLRLIPRFLRRLRTVNGAQKALGLGSSQSYTDRIRASLRVFYAMTSWSAENSIATASAMKARGYGLPGRTSFSPFRLRADDGALLAVSCVLTAGALTGVGMRACQFEYYPRLTKLPLSPAAVVTYASFCALSFLPCIIEAAGRLKWRCYVSKI